ncbi:MAG: T9SS type A sorting domain-containing protein, partial [Bacteroidota bacterium]|nr:T9SS type A sorting domain-containing protein [Bacteroidota bacterium]
NFDNPGDDIVMQGGFQYIALVEYVAAVATDPQLFLLASDARNYTAQVLAMDSAVARGLTDVPLFMTALGFSPDGNIANIDYEVNELDVNDARIYFGDDIVPMIRVVVEEEVNTNDELPTNNLISAYPNPATDQVQVKLEFTQPYSDVQIRLINNLGQTVYTKTLTNTFTTHVEAVSVRELAAGNYMLQVETVDGQRSIPVVVVK